MITMMTAMVASAAATMMASVSPSFPSSPTPLSLRTLTHTRTRKRTRTRTRTPTPTPTRTRTRTRTLTRTHPTPPVTMAVQPIKPADCPDQWSVFKPYLRLERDMRQYNVKEDNKTLRRKSSVRRRSVAAGRGATRVGSTVNPKRRDLMQLLPVPLGTDIDGDGNAGEAVGVGAGNATANVSGSAFANPSEDEGGWHAHSEPINKCFLFCFGAEWHIYSTSHDGFQRVWSVEGTLLGEMRLPNVEYQHYVHREHVDWEMRAETVGVTTEHLAIGDRITGRTATMKRMKTTGKGVMNKLARMKSIKLKIEDVQKVGDGLSLKEGQKEKMEQEISEDDMLFYKMIADDRAKRKIRQGREGSSTVNPNILSKQRRMQHQVSHGAAPFTALTVLSSSPPLIPPPPRSLNDLNDPRAYISDYSEASEAAHAL